MRKGVFLTNEAATAEYRMGKKINLDPHNHKPLFDINQNEFTIDLKPERKS